MKVPESLRPSDRRSAKEFKWWCGATATASRKARREKDVERRSVIVSAAFQAIY